MYKTEQGHLEIRLADMGEVVALLLLTRQRLVGSPMTIRVPGNLNPDQAALLGPASQVDGPAVVTEARRFHPMMHYHQFIDVFSLRKLGDEWRARWRQYTPEDTDAELAEIISRKLAHF